MAYLVSFFIGVLVHVTLAEKYVSVSPADCTSLINIDTEKSVTISYMGASIRWCQYLMYTEESNIDLCAQFTTADIGCSVNVQYSGGTYYPGSPDKEYSCTAKPDSEWCTSRGLLYVTFVQNGTAVASNVQLSIYSKEGTEQTQTDRALVTGIAVGSVVFVLACLTSIGYCCFVRKFSNHKRFHRNRHKPKAVPTEDLQMSTSR